MSLLRTFPVLALAALVLVPAAGAGRGDDPFRDVPAVSAYVEDIPTAGGRRQSTDATPTKVRSLRPAVQRRLERQGNVGAKLREVATSSRYGAVAPAARGERDRVSALVRGERDVETADAFGAAVSAATGGAVHLRILLLLLLLTTGAAVALAGYRARAGRY